ncbi:MAG: DUF4271 domain-containing protein [Ginsengibacter sp.]
MNLKTIISFVFIFALLAGFFQTNAQNRDSNILAKDTVTKRHSAKQKRDTGISSPSRTLRIQNISPGDTILSNNQTVSASLATKETPDSTRNKLTSIDSIQDSVPQNMLISGSSGRNTNKITESVLGRNTMINTKDQGTYFLQEVRVVSGKEFTFYFLCIVLFILGLFKTFYSLYFNNLFRIFFNTSLRQSQLTDQLSQAQFPSFVLNIFFTISAGTYIWLLFSHFNKIQSIKSQTLLMICLISVIVVYLIKFILLKFIGWLAGMQKMVDNYIFVIFLVNKILGVLLLPFVILLAFASPEWIPSIIALSGLFILLFFLSRYVKSYSALETKISMNFAHLIIFVVGAEILPLLIFYKIAVDYIV